MTLGGAAVTGGRRTNWSSASAPAGASTVAAARQSPNRPTPQDRTVCLPWRTSHLPVLHRLVSAVRSPYPLVRVHSGGAGRLLEAPLLRRLEPQPHLRHGRPSPSVSRTSPAGGSGPLRGGLARRPRGHRCQQLASQVCGLEELGPAPELLRRPAEDAPALLEHQRAAGRGEGEVGVLLDEDDADAARADPAEDLVDPAGDERGEAQRELVDEQQPGAAHERPPDSHHLLLAPAEPAGGEVEALVELGEPAQHV